MAQPVINYLAVLAAAVVSMGLGFLWYGPLFGKLWIQLMAFDRKKMDAAKKKGMGKTFFVAFVSTLVMSYVLAHFVDYAEAKTILGGAVLGFWLWIGFFATTQLGSVLWEGKSWTLYLINIFYHIVNLGIMAVILVIWV